MTNDKPKPSSEPAPVGANWGPPEPAARTWEWTLTHLKSLDASLKLQSILNAPDYAILGPSLIELAIEHYEIAVRERDELDKTASGLIDSNYKLILERDALKAEVERLKADVRTHANIAELISKELSK